MMTDCIDVCKDFLTFRDISNQLFINLNSSIEFNECQLPNPTTQVGFIDFEKFVKLRKHYCAPLRGSRRDRNLDACLDILAGAGFSDFEMTTVLSEFGGAL